MDGMDEGAFGPVDDGFDPVTLKIQWGRLISIMDEADVAMLQSAFSTIVSDSRDYAVILLDRQARSIAQAQVCVPHFTCSLPEAARTMLRKFPPETLQPGDVLFTNDPWICHGHLPDLYVIAPVFVAGDIVAYYGAAAHIADIGGRKDELTARDVYEEGLRIPPCKLYRAGKPDDVVFDILEANSRQARLVLGDMGAMVGAGKLVADRVREFLADYGPDSLDRVSDAILARSEAAMRAGIAGLPDGTYHGTVTADGFREPTHIPTRADDPWRQPDAGLYRIEPAAAKCVDQLCAQCDLRPLCLRNQMPACAGRAEQRGHVPPDRRGGARGLDPQCTFSRTRPRAIHDQLPPA